MSAPRIDEDLTVIEHLDWEQGCELFPGCPQEPHWMVYTHQKCCGQELTRRSCDQHLSKLRTYLAKEPPNFWECRLCSGISKDQLCVIDRIEPLR